MGTVFGLKLNIISLVILSILVLIIFGIPLTTIAFFVAKNIKIILIFGALLFVLNLIINKK